MKDFFSIPYTVYYENHFKNPMKSFLVWHKSESNAKDLQFTGDR